MQALGGERGRWQVSTDGGLRPRWRADGRELFFLAPPGPADGGRRRRPARCRASRRRASSSASRSTSFDVAPTASASSSLRSADSDVDRPLTLVTNWPQLLAASGDAMIGTDDRIPMIGTRLGPYEITAKLGEGGMGEVYRATDTKLKREVAIKVLPAAFTEDKERLARFEREAQLLAQLHHPNIASIFGLEESGRHARPRHGARRGPDPGRTPRVRAEELGGSTVRAVTDGVILQVTRVDKWKRSVNAGATRGGPSVRSRGTTAVRYYGSHIELINSNIKPGAHVDCGSDARKGRTDRRCGRLPPALRHLAGVPVDRPTGGPSAASIWPWKIPRLVA